MASRDPLLVQHVDDALIVADKPAGLLSVPGRGEAGRDNLAARVQALHADALVVHRLDQATSGLMVFARGAAMQRALSALFAQRAVHKTYAAVVNGLVGADEGRIELPLAADWPNRPRQMIDSVRGKASTTLWRVLSRDPATVRTRLALQPLTGRSHQLRVHLQASGHAIVGDALYGDADPARVAAGAAQAESRLLLHACALAFLHPQHGHRCSFESAPPF